MEVEKLSGVLVQGSANQLKKGEPASGILVMLRNPYTRSSLGDL